MFLVILTPKGLTPCKYLAPATAPLRYTMQSLKQFITKGNSQFSLHIK